MGQEGFYKTHDFLKMSSISHLATVFCFVIFLAHEILQNLHCFREENIFSQGHSPRTPFLLQTQHKHPYQLRH